MTRKANGKRMEPYSHRERIHMILAGERPDRFAASFWRHFYHKESTAEGTAKAMIDFQKEFDWDFMKINPRADYHIEDWGFKQKYSRKEFEKHEKISFPITKPEDWEKIEPLPMDSPALAEHLKVVSLIRKQVGKELPILMTVFTPLAIAGRMVENDKMLVDCIRHHSDKVVSALKAICQTFRAYVAELRNAGADGIFFATTGWASADKLTWNEYEMYGLEYDLAVIGNTGDDALNLLHICASNNYMRMLIDYPYKAHLYNWDASDPTNLPIDKALPILADRVIVGGVDHTGWLIRSEADEMPHFINQLKEQFDPSRLIIGPGCAIDPKTPAANLRAIRDNL